MHLAGANPLALRAVAPWLSKALVAVQQRWWSLVPKLLRVFEVGW
jgi:hypothetical protein